jgi:hypothetical protein
LYILVFMSSDSRQEDITLKLKDNYTWKAFFFFGDGRSITFSTSFVYISVNNHTVDLRDWYALFWISCTEK